jgi:hypothetical protein
MFIDPKNIMYTILGGVSMIAVTKTWTRLHSRVTGRDDLVKYSTFIKRHARNRREIENLIYECRNLHSIVMQGVDAAYIALMGREPSVIVLYLRKQEDARLFRACLDYLDDPEAVYAIASRQKPAAKEANDDCAECIELSDNAKVETTWFRFSEGKEITDEKVDDAMLEQVIALARSRDKDISQSGACHISVKMQAENKLNDVIVLPTSSLFRKTFRKEYQTDDLTRFTPRDLFKKILDVRRKMSAS